MEQSFLLTEENPRKKAFLLSRLCFGWMAKICYKANKGQIELKDLYRSQEKDKSSTMTDNLEKAWKKELEDRKLDGKPPSLLKVLFKFFFWQLMYLGIVLFFVVIVLRSTQPVVLAALIRCFEIGDYTIPEISLYGGELLLLIILSSLLMNHNACETNLVGMRIRIATSALIYRKILRLSQLSLSKTTAGQVVNLLANDVNRFDLVVASLHYLWIGPIQVVIITYLMWMEIQDSAFVGITAMLLMTLPLQMLLGSLTSKYRVEMAYRTDIRVRVMNEILSGIQVIKMYAWEKPFEKLVKNVRRDEVKSLTKTSYVRAVLVSFMCLVERSTLAITIVFYVIMGHVVRADLVFASSMFFNMLQFTLAIMFPLAIAMLAETLVSIRRLQDFLLLQEKEDIKLQPSEDNSIYLKHVNAHWTPEKNTLQNLSLRISPGSLCAVVGPVGSGKSSLLKLLLGELKASSGVLQLSGEVSYASQESWLFTSTVRNNIIFGQEYNRSDYKEVVKVCALEKDFEQFTEGDKTAVGDRGVSLSGGQKARINLARAVYRDADIYLLDDPLSAVDTKVGRHLFDQCILEYLRGKTRILVTHQLQYLKKADIIIVLNKGHIEAQGTFEELAQSDLDFTRMLVQADEVIETPNKAKLNRLLSVSSVATTMSLPGDDEKSPNENMEEIVKFEGSSLWHYIKNCGGFPMKMIVFLMMIFCQVLLSGSDYWITFWTNQEDEKKIVNSSNYVEYSEKNMSSNFFTIDFIDALKYEYTEQIAIGDKILTFLTTEALMYIYIILIVAAVIVTLTRSFLFFYACMVASKKLHDRMFHCLLETPMRFFDTNPCGRVLNRFSKDMGAIDDQLPRSIMDVLQILLVMSGIIVLIVISNPFLLVIVVILGAMFLQVRKWYIKAAKVFKHIESITKSPVFSYVSSTIDGLTTIRSTGNEKILMRQFDEHQDVHTSAWYLTLLCSISFGLWLDIICILFICSVIAGFVILDQYTSIGGSFAGLGISQSLSLMGMLTFGMKQIAQVVNLLISVERISEYTKLEKEFPLTSKKENLPKDSWPDQGKIEFRKLFLTYVTTDPPILNNLNLMINPTEKIGIVGRTGAGKSSLIAALFRLAPIKGQIFIDNIETGTIGLRDLRRRISIIPQEPVLFSATLRYNLDPFNEFKDDLLWEVLEQVELKGEIESLNFKITEGGSNFSVGQRQLICLARAILRNNKILVLDEATANVDPRTDELIQKTIRRKFKHCTVLTIAHRLNTIMDSDKVLVMDSGCKVEFDHPHILLQNNEGYFTKMLLETGPTMSQTLRKLAEESYQEWIMKSSP